MKYGVRPGLGALLATLLLAGEAKANWTWNLGYQNPAVSTYGVNFLYLGSQWGFEAGIGWVDVSTTTFDDDDEDEEKKKKDEEPAADGTPVEEDDDDESSTTRLHLAGDVDVKYFLSSGKFRPFLQGGLGVGIGAAAGDDSGFGAGAGGGFAGLGLLIGGPGLYAYGSFNVNGNENTFVQAGLGFDL